MKDKILIIEDESMLIDSLSKVLSPMFSVSKALNGDDGLVAALKTKPELILLDILLPKMSGEEFMMKLRKDPWGKKAKVMVITNLEDPDIEKKLRALNIVDYIVKSNISMEKLSERVLHLLHPDRSIYQPVARINISEK